MRAWRRQQRRWSNGFIQVAQRTVAPLWNAPWPLASRLSAVWLVLHQVFFPACAIWLIALVAGIILRMSVMPYLPVMATVVILTFAVAIGMTLPAYVALRRGPLLKYVATMLSLPAALRLSRRRQRAQDNPDRTRAPRTFQAHAETRTRPRVRRRLTRILYSSARLCI